MAGILTKACGFLFLIALAYFLKRVGLFRKEDGIVLSKVLVNVTVPAAVLVNFQGVSIDHDLFLVLLVSFAINFSMLGAGWLLGRGRPGPEAAYSVLNTCTYNLGTFALPFLQAFFSGAAIVVVCVFDIACSIMCYGVSYSVACAVLGRGGAKFSMRALLRSLFSMPPFVLYVVLLALSPLHVGLPEPIISVASMLSSASAPLAMLMLGMLFEVGRGTGAARVIVRVLAGRYLLSAVFACAVYFLLPLPQLYRQIIALLVFSPISCLAPVFTDRCGIDPAPSAVMNSISIPISILCMTAVLMLTSV